MRLDFVKYKAAIFDFDGTLADSDYIIVDSAAKAAKKLGFARSQIAHLKRHFKENMGLNSEIIFKNLFPREEKKTLEKLDKAFHDILIPRYRKAFPHASASLLWLKHKGVRLAICSSSPHRSLKKRIRAVGLPDVFSVVLGKEEFRRPRPAPDGVLKACRLLKVNPRESIYVGDTRFDLMAGHRAGCYTIAFRPKFIAHCRHETVLRGWKSFPELFRRLNR